MENTWNQLVETFVMSEEVDFKEERRTNFVEIVIKQLEQYRLIS